MGIVIYEITVRHMHILIEQTIEIYKVINKQIIVQKMRGGTVDLPRGLSCTVSQQRGHRAQ